MPIRKICCRISLFYVGNIDSVVALAGIANLLI